MTPAHQNSLASKQAQVLDTPAPAYFSTSPLLEGSWANWLIKALTLGQTIQVSNGGVLLPTATDLYIVIRGCVVVTGVENNDSSMPLFVTAMKRGDIIVRPRYSPMNFSYTAKGDVQLLHVHGRGYSEFLAAIENIEAGLMATELTLLALHGAAAHSLVQDEKVRLLQIAQTLAEHPESARAGDGVMVACMKEELLGYAGISNRRIGARVFKILEEEGRVIFEGYKKFIYRGMACS